MTPIGKAGGRYANGTRALFLPILGMILLTLGISAQTRYFPQKAFGDDPQLNRFVSGWYSGQLKALGEPSLWELSKDPAIESYRFLWLRSFHHPVAVRLEVRPDGAATLTMKIASGAGGYPPGKLSAKTCRVLTKAQTQHVIGQVNVSDFWRLPSYDRSRAGNDGAEWVMEASVHGRYHLVSEWTPKNGPIHDLGEIFLFQLAKIDVPKAEIY